jgi:Protein of unknown function (DUF2442)
MKSEIIGGGTLEPEVLNVSPHGFWLLIAGREYFLDFTQFPWFRKATLDQLFTVELHHGDHLFWPLLDVDLDLDRIEHPERYPLVAKTPANSEISAD